MSDAIVINSLERAISGDINDLQSMATRQMADQILYRFAQRFQQGDGGADDTVPRSVTGGLAIRLAGAQVEILPGLLSQFSLTFPAAPGPLDSAMRLGYHRSSLLIAHPGTPSRAMLVEAQVVEVVTLNLIRDVFDVPTQTFVPTAVNKRTELQLAFQVVVGGAPGVFPDFSGGDWVPLWFFLTDGGGVATGTPVDVRSDMQEVFPNSPINSPFNSTFPQAIVVDNSFSTRRPPLGGPILFPVSFGGSLEGRIGDRRFGIRATTGQGPQVDVAPVSGVLSHLYLCPISVNGVTAVPDSGSAKGILVMSDVQPSNGGRTNSAALSLGGLYPGYDAVGAGEALHCGSVMGGNVANSVEWMTQSGGGRALVPIRVGSPLFRFIDSSIVFGGPGTNDIAVDLRGLVPNAAKTALLTVNVVPNVGSINGSVSFRPDDPAAGNPGNADVTAPIDFATTGGVNNPNSFEIEVPVFFQSDSDIDKLLSLRLEVDGASTVDIEVSCHGWTL